MPSPDFQRLFEAAPALFMVLAPDPPRFTILAASDAYLHAVKQRRAPSFIGRPVFEALPPGPEDTSSEVNSRASFQRAIDTRAPDTMIQRHDIVRPQSEGGGYVTRYWSVVNAPVLDEAGAVLYVLHRVEDVTALMEAQQQGSEQRALAERLRTRAGDVERELYRSTQEIQAANQRLREANDRLGALDRAKTAFFSNISHEFRTPLTLLLGSIEALLAAADPAAREPLELAHRNALRLQRLVDGLLEYSRLEAGRAQATFRPTDVGAVTAALASSFDSVCARSGLRLRIDSPPSTTPVYVDRDGWEKIVLNLVSNAFKFTLAGEIEVRVREDGGRCVLRVRDTGLGIPAEELSRVFERFHRVASTQGRSLEGTGLGLSLVRELVHLHGGELRVESTVGRGSTFTVSLPLGTAHLPADCVAAGEEPAPAAGAATAYVEEALGWIPDTGPERPPADAAPAEAAASGVRARVLVADDNADMRAHVARLLAPRFDVEAVADGRAALEAVRRRRPDLVLTDVMMPRLDGFGLLRELRADPGLRTIPVVMISARAGDEARGEGIEAGADDYLVKPFSARELVARVATHLRLAGLREEVVRAAGRAEALQELDRRKDAFLAMLSHELRNPLAPIRNSLYVLERSAPGGEQARRAQRTIDRQVALLTRLVEDLLDVSRIAQGKLRVEQERLELGALVRRVAEDARASFEVSGVDLALDVPREPLWLEGDPARLAQAVANLLANAARFTPRGGHTVLSLRADAEASILEVRDDGVGIAPALQRDLFAPFVQADQAIDRSAGGLGLGLALVKGIVEAHGGTVAAESAGPGQGATLTVRLPVHERGKPRLAVVPPQTEPPSRPLLLIEDNRDAAQSMKDALELSGHTVEVAYDGPSGLALARSHRPAAIICDIGLPGMSGYEVAQEIRTDQELRSVCLVAVTGYAALDDRERSRRAGFDHHVPKPPDLDALERILRACAPGAAAASRDGV